VEYFDLKVRAAAASGQLPCKQAAVVAWSHAQATGSRA
jgi:hypothetical protein